MKGKGQKVTICGSKQCLPKERYLPNTKAVSVVIQKKHI